MKVPSALASLLVLALLAAGCGGGGGGGSDTKSADDWADGVCSAINTWTDSLTSASGSVTGANLSEESLTQAANDLKDATAQLKDDLSGLGKPDLDAGDKAEETVDDLSNDIQDGVDKIDGAIQDAKSGGNLLGAVTTMTTAITAMGTQVQSAFSKLESLDPAGELESAFQNASSCQSLTSGQS